MNVAVMQLDDAVFKNRFRWWSNWVDVAVYDYQSTPFLLQMRINRLNGKSFKSICMSGKFIYRQTRCCVIGDLIPMGKET